MFESQLRIEYEKFARSECRFPNIQDVNRFSPFLYEEYIKTSLQKNVDNSMIEDGIFYLDTDIYGDNYYLDSESGLLYRLQDGVFYVADFFNYSGEYDIFDSAYFRRYITDPTFRNKKMVYLDALSGGILPRYSAATQIAEIFAAPIIEYTAFSKDDLNCIVSEMTDILSTSEYFEKVWFRGQREEYLTVRSPNTLHKLGLNEGYSKMPSLIPSLGRQINEGNFYDIASNMKRWVKAFKVWTLTQSEEFKDVFKSNSDMYQELVKSIEPEEMVPFINKCPYDIGEYLLFQSEKEQRSGILSSQQYGGYTSMLDITDDLDVALFFTQSKFNQSSNKFELCNPSPKNVIYVFVEGKNTGTIDMSEQAFLMATNDGIRSLPARILNQKCGLLIGANCLAKNTYGFRVVAKIYLNSPNIITTKTVDELFPDIKMDSLYKVYSDVRPRLKGLYG